MTGAELSPIEQAAEQRGYERGMVDAVGLIHIAAVAGSTRVPSLQQDGEDITAARFADAVSRLDRQALAILRPWDAREAITPKEAATIAGCEPSTVYKWVEKYSIGRNRVGAVFVSRAALAMLLDGDFRALAVYLSGDRAGPLVAPYFERAGLLRVA